MKIGEEKAQTRVYYLDNVKTFLTIMLVFFHAAGIYNGFNSGGAYADEYSGVLWAVSWWLNCFFMGAFFFISGYFIPASFDFKGYGVFIRKKFSRLLLPLFIFIVPVFSLRYGQLSSAHGWYLLMLFAFSCAYALLYGTGLHMKGAGRQMYVAILLVVASVVLCSYGIQRVGYYHGRWWREIPILSFEPFMFPQYLLMFVLGVAMYRFSWLQKVPRKASLVLVGVSALCTMGIVFNAYTGYRYSCIPVKYVQVLEPGLGVLVSLGLVLGFRDFCNYSTSLFRRLAANAFGVYVFHQIIIRFSREYTDGLLHIGGIPKTLIYGSLTLVLSYALTAMLRKSPVIRKIL